ncbi:mannose-1-phosphate guanylyltransferase/mannose-6-phosphate isomerase [uncultured Cohaesibacter sp.]|uniref:mannose-1-phosphate guanylyltransferase/mannose-6-phosphate isomerase n=1 Tax=uncultured Cohaesibacter sp. TaxID=1002546 RepID=UPI00293191E5|nr:mannose-1-phosphate guanylyltransferase/mannose-6-phosphate isomerase [uncultured Cohaesibacter sp.]
MITPILLCGGSGKRLWPLSRKSYPKQFIHLDGDETMFQASANRFIGEGFHKPVIVTNSDFRFIVVEQLLEVGIDPGPILIEPERRNTAPAVLAAAMFLARKDPDSLLLVAPTDHVVPDAEAFRAAVKFGQQAARDGQLVTFGIKPTHPETGYGYLEFSTAPQGEDLQLLPLKQFVEKPELQSATEMVASGNFLWNAGIFLFSARAIIKAFETHAPELVEPVSNSVNNAEEDLGFLRLAADSWSRAEEISIDYAVMEKAGNLAVVPFASDWSDLGGWDGVWRQSNKDEKGVSTFGSATAIDCNNCLIWSEDRDLEVVAIGLENVITIAMPDAVLVIDASRAQDVRKAVDALKSKKSSQAEAFAGDPRQWGWFESPLLKGLDTL